MPNHVTNKVTITGTGAEDAINALYEDGQFNFGFFPMPDELRLVTSPVRIVTLEEREQAIKDWEAKDDNYKNMIGKSFPITAEMQKDLIEKYGTDNWYDWAVNNWGTKWAGYDGDKLTDNVVIFNTAWSTPYPALLRLSELYPETTISVEYADEDFGSNTGTYSLINGAVVNEYIPKYSRESLDLAYRIQGEPDWLFEFVFDDYQDTEEDKARFLEEVESEMYLNWTVNKMVEVCIVPDADTPSFCFEYLKERAVAYEHYEFAADLQKEIEAKLA